MAAARDVQLLKAQIWDKLGSDARNAGLEALKVILTEENTDALIRILVDSLKLPFWLRWLPVEKVLDRLLPDALLNVLEDLLE